MPNESILIVEDNFDNQELARLVLELEGFRVRVSDDAPQALQAIEAEKPTLILMDLQLPGMDGLELTRRLRRENRFDDIVIVALTAYAMKGDEESARAAGCDGYITKPIDTRHFAAVVRGYLQSGRNSAPAADLQDERADSTPACR